MHRFVFDPAGPEVRLSRPSFELSRRQYPRRSLQSMSTRVVRNVGWALLMAGGVDALNSKGVSPAAGWLAALIAAITLVTWIRRDATDRHIPLPYDWPWLMLLGWPISWLWYGRRSRRSWAAAIGLAALPIAFLLGDLIARGVAMLIT